MEAPDECGHHGDAEHKIYSIEQIDEKVVKPVIEELTARGERFKILVCPDHPTPLCLMTHVSDPVPYLIYDSEKKIKSGVLSYTEDCAAQTGIYVTSGVELMKRFLDK